MPVTQQQDEATPRRPEAGEEAAPHESESTLAGRDAASAHRFAGSEEGAESLTSLIARRRWSIVAGACLVVAATLLLLGRMDAAFVVATLGAVAWFWNERNRLRPHGIEEDVGIEDEDEEFEERDEK